MASPATKKARPLRLKRLLAALGIQQREWAAAVIQLEGRAVGRALSPAAAAMYVNHGTVPAETPAESIRRQTVDFLRARGADEAAIATAFERDDSDAPIALAAAAATNKNTPIREVDMLLAAATLRPDARKKFGLFRSPFEDPEAPEDVFMWADFRYAREAAWDTSKHGGFRAIVGESGSGKTTLLNDLRDRIVRENAPIILIEPYVLGMEDSDKRGRQLKSADIVAAMLQVLMPPGQTAPQASQARFERCHRLLKDTARAGFRVCLLIEEGHALPVQTLKHLKRWRELKDGLRQLLGILLVGQPELAERLDPRNPAVREVAQRCELVELAPLAGALPDFIATRFGRIGKDAAEIFEASAYEAMSARLTFPARRPGGKAATMLYPLAVQNLAVRAINLAAELGVPKVSAEIVRGC